ncbi:ABC transporter ATP-binding protein [Spirochaeta cellobiosiphila]|uniref:ABC transporter ATP-binding protein n=1 Tax=Spirochaeta cellobiosiphila TaxID=504483 RepID=UPI00040DA08D|nr:ABC transporter ATP-binding protein [Spirochaeta cellobiosiphila]
MNNQEKEIKMMDPLVYRKLWGFVKPHKVKLFISTIMLIIALAGELYVPILIQKTVDNQIMAGLTVEQAQNGIMHNVIILFFILLSIVVFSFGQIYLLAILSQDVMTAIRHTAFNHILNQNMDFLNKTPVGKLVSSVTSDVETINELFNSVFTSLLRDGALIIGVTITLLFLDIKLALITLLTVPPAFVLIYLFRIASRKVFRNVQKCVSSVNTYLSEHFNGVQIVQLFGAEKKTSKEFQVENQNLYLATMKQVYVQATFRPLVDLLSSISMAVVIYVGGKYLGKDMISLGILIAFINLLSKFFDPIKDMADKFGIMQSAMAGGERIFTLLDSPQEVIEEQSTMANDIEGNIEFRDVHFSYKKGEPILKGISFKAAPGETIALVGYTGAGKTTITNLVTRLWPIDSGSILLDGKDINDMDIPTLRKSILPVLQDVVLFSGTIRENLTLGKEIDNEVLVQALKAVHADFVLNLPEQMDTKLHEGASNLSAGQRQLLSFARALVHNPKVLILDEATSNVDTDTEHLIQKALPVLIEGRTSLVIAHRLSTIRKADRILVLEQGKIIESGTHQELLSLQGTYYNLYQLQFNEDL